MERDFKFILHYLNRIESIEELQRVIQTRLDSYGAYKYLNKKTIDEIKGYTSEDFKLILESLYSTQRVKVYKDLTRILYMDGGLSYFKGFINGILSRKERAIDEIHNDQRPYIQKFKRDLGLRNLGFGKSTISQLAHFCKPNVYLLSNHKSQKVMEYLYGQDVSDDYYKFKDLGNTLVNNIRKEVEQSFDTNFELLFREYKYILLDDFVEFVYEDIS